MNRIELLAPDDLPEVEAGDDLASLLVEAMPLREGDVVLVTSKVVAKAEGQLREGPREAAVDAAAVRLVARRGPTRIVRTHHGLTLAAGGVDASNVRPGMHVLLPRAPDASARALRARIGELTGAVVGVLITDTAGRAWREGQVDIAIGAAGLVVLDDHAGRRDVHGNVLAVTSPAVADEIASASQLVQGKLAGRPFAVLRGRADLVLPPGEDGPGATALVRPEGTDLFGFGAREAVVRALAGEPVDRRVFGAPAEESDLLAALRTALAEPSLVLAAGVDLGERTVLVAAPSLPALKAVCFAHGWTVVDHEHLRPEEIRCRIRPVVP